MLPRKSSLVTTSSRSKRRSGPSIQSPMNPICLQVAEVAGFRPDPTFLNESRFSRSSSWFSARRNGEIAFVKTRYVPPCLGEGSKTICQKTGWRRRERERDEPPGFLSSFSSPKMRGGSSVQLIAFKRFQSGAGGRAKGKEKTQLLRNCRNSLKMLVASSPRFSRKIEKWPREKRGGNFPPRTTRSQVTEISCS